MSWIGYKNVTVGTLLTIGLFAACKHDYCEDLDCLNGGVCDDGKCECAFSYYGDRCQISSELIHFGTVSIDSSYSSTGSSWGIGYGDHHLYIANSRTYKVFKVDTNRSQVSWLGWLRDSLAFHTADTTADSNFIPQMVYYHNQALFIACELDSENVIIKVDEDGTLRKKLDIEVAENGSFMVDGLENIYVYANDQIKKYDSSGLQVGTYGGTGTGNGQFNNGAAPIQLMYDRNTDLWAYDAGNMRIQRLSSDGAYVSQWAVGQTTSLAPFFLERTNDEFYLTITSEGVDKFARLNNAGIVLKEWRFPEIPYFTYKESQVIVVGDLVYMLDHFNDQVVIYLLPQEI